MVGLETFLFTPKRLSFEKREKSEHPRTSNPKSNSEQQFLFAMCTCSFRRNKPSFDHATSRESSEESFNFILDVTYLFRGTKQHSTCKIVDSHYQMPVNDDALIPFWRDPDLDNESLRGAWQLQREALRQQPRERQLRLKCLGRG